MAKAAGGLYLLLGPEEGEKDAFVKRLLEAAGKEHGGPPEVQRYYPFETDLGQVLAQLSNGSLFAAFRVAILHNAEELKSKREVDLLGAYAAHPSPDTALLLLSAEVARMDKRIERLGAKVEQRWETAADERGCNICAPLHNQPEEVWSTQFPQGPPAHGRCRCRRVLVARGRRSVV